LVIAMSVTQLDFLREKLKDLRVQHRQLDLEIEQLSRLPSLDSLELRRMKKRKLSLKETIVKLESQLIPDLNA
jgi:hypothetical protein